MTRGWLEDVADRLEAAAELARALLAARAAMPPPVRVRIEFLAERLWQVGQRLGILGTLGTLGTLGSGPRAQVVHALCDLYRVARRAAELARAEGHAGLAEGLGTIVSELHAILAEIAAGGGAPGDGGDGPDPGHAPGLPVDRLPDWTARRGIERRSSRPVPGPRAVPAHALALCGRVR